MASALSLAFGAQAHADQVSISATRDTTIYENGAALSNGQGTGLFCGPNGRHSPRRALLAFDVAGSVPAGARITAALLRLELSRGRATATTIELHRVSAAWSEGSSAASGEGGAGAGARDGDATWSHRRWPAERWLTPGGDYTKQASASTIAFDLGTYTWEGAQLLADVQGFLDDPANNHGWILVSDDTAGEVAKRFASREASAGAGPTLLVSFEPPAVATGACCFPDGACGVSLDPGDTCKGSYLGAQTRCEPGICPEPRVACCSSDAHGSCEVRTMSQCSKGASRGVSCDPNPCPVVLQPFVDPLPLPAPATPVEGAVGGAATYHLRMVQTTQQLHRDLPPSTVWGFHDGVTGGYPGPTIEARRGAAVSVIWENDLRDEEGKHRTSHVLPVDSCLHGAHDSSPRTVVHLHGGHVPAAYDGQPEATLLPGESVRYEYPNAQRAATIWYHDHAMGITRLNVYMGLAGFYLIRDDEEQALGLPSGTHEIPLVIQDRSFYPDGRLRYPESWQETFFGDNALVNGKVSPYLEVDRGLYRFRILNGSTSRTYKLTLSNGHPIRQIGNDGGLLPESASVGQLTLSPGERADVLIDFRYAGREVILENSANSPFPFGSEGPPLTDIMKFIVGEQRAEFEAVPAQLSTIDPPAESEAVLSRDLVLTRSGDEELCGQGMWLINELGWHDVTEKPHLGTSEIWRFVNQSGITHPMHMHMLFFRVLDRQRFELVDNTVHMLGQPQAPHRGELGWKDTVQVGPFEVVRVLAHFEDYAGRFPYHCHLIEHEDHGMMRQFEAIAVCGDGAVARGHEECDDGNTRAQDGCDAACKIEKQAVRSVGNATGCSVAVRGRAGSTPGWLLACLCGWLIAARRFASSVFRGRGPA